MILLLLQYLATDHTGRLEKQVSFRSLQRRVPDAVCVLLDALSEMRRQSRTPAHRMVRSGVAFDLTARSAAVEGAVLPLTRSEYAICEYLALHAGQTFTKEQIYEAVFGIDGTADDTAVTQHIKNIRAKLRAAGVPEPEKLLNTVWGVGYRWKSED